MREYIKKNRSNVGGSYTYICWNFGRYLYLFYNFDLVIKKLYSRSKEIIEVIQIWFIMTNFIYLKFLLYFNIIFKA